MVSAWAGGWGCLPDVLVLGRRELLGAIGKMGAWIGASQREIKHQTRRHHRRGAGAVGSNSPRLVQSPSPPNTSLCFFRLCFSPLCSTSVTYRSKDRQQHQQSAQPFCFFCQAEIPIDDGSLRRFSEPSRAPRDFSSGRFMRLQFASVQTSVPLRSAARTCTRTLLPT